MKIKKKLNNTNPEGKKNNPGMLRCLKDRSTFTAKRNLSLVKKKKVPLHLNEAN